mmetsp:Transcript_27298/g.81323  ORF Transcript_27298/g.81323 Transcript_27298/m.81323 type:complete len:268 (+) Transcript_27298:2293-3096(+)
MARVVLVAGVLHLLAEGAGSCLEPPLLNHTRRPRLLVQSDALVTGNLHRPPCNGSRTAQVLCLDEGVVLLLEELPVASEPGMVRLRRNGGVALVRLRLRLPVERAEGIAGSLHGFPLRLHNLLASLLRDVLRVLMPAADLVVRAAGATDEVHGADGGRRGSPEAFAPSEAKPEGVELLLGVVVPLRDLRQHLLLDHLPDRVRERLHAGRRLAGRLVLAQAHERALDLVDALRERLRRVGEQGERPRVLLLLQVGGMSPQLVRAQAGR